MVFSSTVFLFIFLPSVLLIYFLLRREFHNTTLLVASLLFYAWGEVPYVMLGSIALNYCLGLWVERLEGRRAKWAVAISVTINLALIASFKYANFFADNLNLALAWANLPLIHLPPVRLPLGISFFSFHAMSYVIDIYRRQAKAMRNPLNLALYIAFFPQLIAGPIVRYHEIADQFVTRAASIEGIATGIRRFIIGLGKKLLIANAVAAVSDPIFATPTSQLTPGLAWLGTICYTLQIYFDFSGYSDMAIGLALMFGFKFPENFDYPYVSRSITEFWRRWHITLSNWFRDYLYIPLGGNRVSAWRTYLNLIIVFLLCGLWHGASWTFIAWGVFHGFFLVLERLTNWQKRFQPYLGPLANVYALTVVMVGWVLFRADSFGQAIAFLKAMAGTPALEAPEFGVRWYLTNELLIVLCAAVIGSTPWIAAVRRKLAAAEKSSIPIGFMVPLARVALIAGVFLGSVMKLAAGTHNPFIYFRF